METQEASLSSIFSSVHYTKSQKNYEQDRQWLADQYDSYKMGSAEGNDSDTMSCSELDCIDDLKEYEDLIQFSTTDVNNEYIETDQRPISIGDFMIHRDDTCEPNKGQPNNVYVNFVYEQQDHSNSDGNTQNDYSYLGNLGFIAEPHTLYIDNVELGRESHLVDVTRCLVEEQSDDINVSCKDKKHEDCVEINFLGDTYTRTIEHVETRDSSNRPVGDFNLKYFDDKPVNDCLDCGSDENENEVQFANISAVDEEQTQYDSSSSHDEDCTEGIKVILINKQLVNDEEENSHEKEPYDYVEVSLYTGETTDQDQLEQNDTRDKNIKHQTTQTCELLFTDKEKSPADMFICEYCYKVFANQYKLDSHRSRSHGSQKGVKRINVARLENNTEANDDWPPNIQKLARRINGKKLFFCNECSYSVDRCDSITKHMFRVHSHGRPVPQFQCEVCGKLFVDKAYLRNHKVSHMTEKLHSCDVCGRGFHRQPSLKRHLQTHTADRQYSCTLCAYQTNRKHMMYKHIEHHQQGRAYVCPICHSHSYTQLAYRSHMYEHRVPTHSCTFCKVGFSSKERMMSHMRKAHSAFEINVYKNEPKQDTFE